MRVKNPGEDTMRKLLLAGTSMWALSASAVSASAAPITFDYIGRSLAYSVPNSGLYNVLAIGGQGGEGSTAASGAGGFGATASGDFTLSAGEVLTIAVGGKGADAVPGGGGGGGGGSFVTAPGNTPLVVAGGGGGGATGGAYANYRGGNAEAGSWLERRANVGTRHQQR